MSKVICIEVKLSEKWDWKWEKPIRSLRTNKKVKVDKMFGVYTGKRAYLFDDFEVLPVQDFLQKLHREEFFDT